MKTMGKLAASIIMFAASAGMVSAADSGLTTVKSAHSVADSLDKLEKVLASAGMNVFGRINHAEGAMKAGMELRPTELLIFGNPKVGTVARVLQLTCHRKCLPGKTNQVRYGWVTTIRLI